MTRAPAPLETDNTAMFGRFLDVALPRRAHWFHIPNGGEMTGRGHGAAKKQGQKSGEPDLVVLIDGRALGIESKREGRKANGEQRFVRSDDQMCIAAEWAWAGCPYAVCYDVEDVFRFLTSNGVKLRANVGV